MSAINLVWGKGKKKKKKKKQVKNERYASVTLHGQL